MKRVYVEVLLEVHDDCSLTEALMRAGIKAKQLSHDAPRGGGPLELKAEGAVVTAKWQEPLKPLP